MIRSKTVSKRWKLTLWLLLGTWSVSADSAQADDLKICAPDDSRSCVQFMTEGETSPFTGYLMTPRRAATMIARAEGQSMRLQLEVARVSELWQVKGTLAEELRRIDQEAGKKREDLLHQELDRLREASERPWWTHPLFVSACTLIGASLLLWASIEALKAIGSVS